MSTVDHLVEEARALSNSELDDLICRLTDHAGRDRPPLSPAWEAEIQRRLKEIDSGKAEILEWEEAREAIWPGRREPDA